MQDASYTIVSHDRTENPDLDAFIIDKDAYYDLINIKTKKTFKTLKGSTLIRYARERRYSITNLISLKRMIYCWRQPAADDAVCPRTIGKVDFNHDKAAVEDIDLHGIQLSGKRISDDIVAIDINGKSMEFRYETQRINPLCVRMGDPAEETLLTITGQPDMTDEKMPYRTNLGYQGKIGSIELLQTGDKYALVINYTNRESGPMNGRGSFTLHFKESL